MFFAIAGDIWGAAAEGVAHRTSKTRQKGSENATQISGKKTSQISEIVHLCTCFFYFLLTNFSDFLTYFLLFFCCFLLYFCCIFVVFCCCFFGPGGLPTAAPHCCRRLAFRFLTQFPNNWYLFFQYFLWCFLVVFLLFLCCCFLCFCVFVAILLEPFCYVLLICFACFFQIFGCFFCSVLVPFVRYFSMHFLRIFRTFAIRHNFVVFLRVLGAKRHRDSSILSPKKGLTRGVNTRCKQWVSRCARLCPGVPGSATQAERLPTPIHRAQVSRMALVWHSKLPQTTTTTTTTTTTILLLF